VYQLADPHPLTIDELYAAMAVAADRRVIRVPVTRRLAKFAIDKVPGVYDLLRIPSAAVDYMTHPTHYLTTNQMDLEGSGIACPPVQRYLPVLVDYMRRHPDVSASAMI
jgi:hypothetical protein